MTGPGAARVPVGSRERALSGTTVRPMRARRRRRVDKALVGAGGLLVGVAAIAGSVGGDQERIASYWTSATIDASGDAGEGAAQAHAGGPCLQHRARNIAFGVGTHDFLRKARISDGDAPILLEKPPGPTKS